MERQRTYPLGSIEPYKLVLKLHSRLNKPLKVEQAVDCYAMFDSAEYGTLSAISKAILPLLRTETPFRYWGSSRPETGNENNPACCRSPVSTLVQFDSLVRRCISAAVPHLTSSEQSAVSRISGSRL